MIGAESLKPGMAAEKTTSRSGIIAWFVEWLAVLSLGATTLLVLGNALSRYLLQNPLPWTEEIVVNLMVWLGAAGLVLATMRGVLITCDIVTMRLGPRLARRLGIGCTLLSAAVMGLFSWFTVQYLLVFGHDLTPVLRIPKAWMIGGLLFATTGVTLALLARLLQRRPEASSC